MGQLKINGWLVKSMFINVIGKMIHGDKLCCLRMRFLCIY